MSWLSLLVFVGLNIGSKYMGGGGGGGGVGGGGGGGGGGVGFIYTGVYIHRGLYIQGSKYSGFYTL